MADVSRRRDRAQLLLVGALALAVVFLSLSLLLNSVIYTENLATRQTHADAERAQRLHTGVVGGLSGAIEYANGRDTASFADRRDAYQNATDALISTLGNYSATDGVAASVERDGLHEGTRIVGNDSSTGMVDRTGSGDWTVATDSTVRAFRLDVNVSSVGAGDDVRITLDDGTPRDVVVEDTTDGDSGDDARVRIESPGTDPTCTLSDGRIDLTAGTVDGEYCHGLADARPRGPVNVSVTNGDQLRATYALVVDRNEVGLRTAVDTENFPGQCTPPSPPTYSTTSSDDPYTTPAIYAATAQLDAETKNLDHARTVRAAPGEVGPAASAPTFTQFDATPGGTFTVDWATTDPNAAVDTVTVRLVYAANGTVFDQQQYTSVTAGSTTFSGVPSNTVYYVEGNATDGTSARQVREIHDTGGGC